MEKNMLLGAAGLAPLFGVFAIFLAALFFRSRHNAARSDSDQTFAPSRIKSVLIYTGLGMIMLIGIYFLLKLNNFMPSWSLTVCMAWIAFFLGELYGRLKATRPVMESRP